MALDNKRPNEIAEADLQALIYDGVAEGTTIDYKESLYGNSDDERREFLFDVSSLANAAGGHLVIGMAEQGGIPTDLCGLESFNVDEVKLRFENMLRDNLKPRIPGVTMDAVSLQDGNRAFVLHIPRSFAAPHMVEFKNHIWFYSRNSAGKFRLDVDQLRSAFTQSETLRERMRVFRQDRVSRVIGTDTPIPLPDEPKVVLHLIPLNAFDLAVSIDVSSVLQHHNLNLPIKNGMSSPRYNFDGYLLPNDQGYVQVFRSGIIEAVCSDMFTFDRFIPYVNFEAELVDAVRRYLLLQQQINVLLPVVIMLSLVGVQGYRMAPNGRDKGYAINRDVLPLPEAVTDSFNADVAKLLKPMFDTIWNAAGLKQSRNYDEDGNWMPDR